MSLFYTFLTFQFLRAQLSSPNSLVLFGELVLPLGNSKTQLLGVKEEIKSQSKREVGLDPGLCIYLGPWLHPWMGVWLALWLGP